MRRRWFVLMLVLLAGCGQPLQISATPPPETQASAQPVATRTLFPSASSVPGDTASASPMPDISATQVVPTSAAATQISTAIPATPAGQPSPTAAVIVVPRTAVPATNEQLWRAQEQDRQVAQPPQIYVATSLVSLLWYDPLTGQSLPIGTIIGEFPAQAHFTLRSTQQPALEVPYRINNDFGLTSISDAVRDRMKDAGYTQSVEAYVITTDAVQLK